MILLPFLCSNRTPLFTSVPATCCPTWRPRPTLREAAWLALQQRDMTTDFSWNVPAGRYMDLFKQMLGINDDEDDADVEVEIVTE